MKNQRKLTKFVSLCLLFSVGFYFAFWQTIVAPAASFGEPKRVEVSDYGDCAVCHQGNKVLPDNHTPTKKAKGKLCKACHNANQQSLAGKMPLSHFHQLNGISCSSCHGNEEPFTAIATDQCFDCHKSFEEVAKLTKDLAVNPHDSHFGYVECEQCHKVHQKSVLKCNECHDFDFRTP